MAEQTREDKKKGQKEGEGKATAFTDQQAGSSSLLSGAIPPVVNY